MSIEHYENFPVASWLCPARLRPAVTAIYAFARTADDLADEGDASAEARLADLADYRRDLLAAARGRTASARWSHVFEPLREMLSVHALPLPLLTDLLDAFAQDVVKHRYADRTELLDYCRRSANPVGRLMLHLYRVHDSASQRRSDAICSALQLANFWQDLGVDTRRGRLYIPETDCLAAGVSPSDLLQRHDSPEARMLIASMVDWTRAMMLDGAPLAHTVAGRAGWELRAVVQGGLRILEKIEGLRYATLVTRPTLGPMDLAVMTWRVLWMRAPARRLAGTIA